MPTYVTDPAAALAQRRAVVVGLATELAERAQRQNRPLRPSELADYRALDAARVRLDNLIRQAQLDRRADPADATVGRWARSDPRAGAMAVAPGSGSSRALGDALAAYRR